MESASFKRRVLSIFYDFLILFFIIIIITFIIQQIIIQLELTTLETIQISKTESITMISSDTPVTLVLKNLWVIISFLYFGYYWRKRGQTLGMKVWGIKAVTNDGNLMNWGNVLKRYVFSLLGLGLIWMLFNKSHLAFQDKMSNTKLIKIN